MRTIGTDLDRFSNPQLPPQKLNQCRRALGAIRHLELPTRPTMDRDQNTPKWVQHIAMEVEDYDALLAARKHVQGEGVEVIGPVNHGIFQSIYFFDPNGHRVELVANTQTQEQLDELKRVAPAMLEEWSRTRKAPRHAAWLHELEFTGDSTGGGTGKRSQ